MFQSFASITIRSHSNHVRFSSIFPHQSVSKYEIYMEKNIYGKKIDDNAWLQDFEIYIKMIFKRCTPKYFAD